MADSFAHLHVHTEYSMLDGAARISELMQAVEEQKMPAVAMTDHGNVFGAYEFWSKAKAHGVKPIIGLEAYFTPNTSRFERRRVRHRERDEADTSGMVPSRVAAGEWFRDTTRRTGSRDHPPDGSGPAARNCRTPALVWRPLPRASDPETVDPETPDPSRAHALPAGTA